MNYLRLYLLRHGQTENFEKRLFNGWTDVPLSELGRHQLDVSVAALQDINFTAIYSSDLSRALYGAKQLAEKRGLDLIVSQDWREMNFGDCEGLSFGEIQDKFPELASRIMRPIGGEEINFPGGESDKTFTARVAKTLASLCETHETGVVCLVSHAGVARAVLSEFMHLSVRDMWSITQSFAGLHVMDIFPDGTYILKVLNAYLGPEGYYQKGPGWEFLSQF
ncbi:MAG: histidine phosphatase family protein [Deltaproteobacteria bacterium]|jgi:broad specificity phosphatase PhoE|nr:histidine phosphatase family protein [Deltaproteobacteria bacterium]